MEIPDLMVFPDGHAPSPYGFSIGCSLPPGISLIAVGWLKENIPAKGNTPSNCISRLIDAYENRMVINDMTMGIFNCRLCSMEPQTQLNDKPPANVIWNSKEYRIDGHGHFLVRIKNEAYMAPQLIIHYIVSHQYQPPEQFIAAVSNGKFLRRSDFTREENMMLLE